jgi:hypothetical protein
VLVLASVVDEIRLAAHTVQVGVQAVARRVLAAYAERPALRARGDERSRARIDIERRLRGDDDTDDVALLLRDRTVAPHRGRVLAVDRRRGRVQRQGEVRVEG